jgi:putative peptide zinc metalloprotease protein
VQLTPILYAVLEEIREDRSIEQVAEHASARLGRTVTADNVATLVDDQLRPLGLLKTADGQDPELKRSNPLLGLRMKVAVTDAHRTRRLTAPFAVLFNPLLVVAVTAGFVAVAWWVLLHKGLASATYEAFKHPGLLLVLVAVMLLSAGFHELGHGAAATRGGAAPGTMGAGIYLVWPAFYTDVTDSYRLGRWGRIRTDLGGLYFDALVAVGIFGLWAATRWDGWLLVVAAQTLGMLRQLTPLVKFDGYHILCDVTGVPDLFARIKPILLSFLPKYWRSPEVAALKPWVRVVATLWVLVVVPMLAFSLFAMVFSLPRVAGTAWARVQQHWDQLTAALGSGDVVDAGARLVAVLATGFPVLAIGLMLGRLGYSVGKRTWLRTRGKPLRRGVAGLVALLLVGLLALAWWPQPDRYRPVQPWERGTLVDATPLGAMAAPRAVRVGYRSGAQLSFPAGASMPTQSHPQLALVLVPEDGSGSATGGSGSGSEAAHPWIFPFNRPLAPKEGDNQAMAVNYTDGGTRYDVAFAMVWVEDGADALQKNEAYAFASCKGCTTVAVAFQVVLVVGQSDVIIPQNIAAAVNYNCLSCVTVALAQQLALTVSRVPGEEAMASIRQIWADAMALQGRIEELSFAEITSALDDLEVRMITVLKQDGALVVPAQATPSAQPSESASPSAEPSLDAGSDPSDAPTSDTDTGGSDQSGTDQTPDPSPSPSAPTESPSVDVGSPTPSP